MGNDRGDSFPIDLNQMEFHLGSKLKGKLSRRSYPIQYERKWNTSFLSVLFSGSENRFKAPRRQVCRIQVARSAIISLGWKNWTTIGKTGTPGLIKTTVIRRIAVRKTDVSLGIMGEIIGPPICREMLVSRTADKKSLFPTFTKSCKLS